MVIHGQVVRVHLINLSKHIEFCLFFSRFSVFYVGVLFLLAFSRILLAI